MISSARWPRKLRTLDSPRTHFIASVILLLPLPLGPITAVIPGENFTTVLSAKDLNPFNSSRSNCMTASFLSIIPLNHIFNYTTYTMPSILHCTVSISLFSRHVKDIYSYPRSKYVTLRFFNPLTLDVRHRG